MNHFLSVACNHEFCREIYAQWSILFTPSSRRLNFHHQYGVEQKRNWFWGM